MPSSVIVGLAYALSAVAAGGTWAAVAAAFISATISSFALSAISSALIKKPSNEATTSLSQSRTVTTRQPAGVRRVIYGQMKVGGTFVYMDALDPNGGGQSLNMIIVFAGHEIDSFENVYFDDLKLSIDFAGDVQGRYRIAAGNSYAHVEEHLGSPEQTASHLLMGWSAGKWTGNHRLRGIAYLYVVLVQNIDLFPTGVPNITAVVNGKKVYDPRTGLIAWSDNPALCLADYLSDPKYGLGAAYGTEIDLAELISAANICDELVLKADGTTEKRYTCNGMFETDAKPASIIEQLLTSMSGQCVYVGGMWKIRAAAWRPPTITLDESDVRGPLKIQTRLSRRDVANAVKGIYVSPDNKWQPADFPPVTNQTYEDEDQGERIFKDIQLPFTISASMAQRIAKIELERMRQQISITMPCKLSAYRAQVGDVVMIDNTRMGWAAKPFEVTSAALALDEDGTVGVDLGLRETAAGVYDWNSGEETLVDLAPDTNLPDPFSIAAPGTPNITEGLYQVVTTGELRVKATVECAASASGFVTGYRFEYHAEGGSEWITSPLNVTPIWTFQDLSAGTYVFRVRAVSSLGVSSPYTDEVTKEILGLQAPPADVTGFYVIKSTGVAIANWNLHADLDVRIGGKIEIGYASATSGATWNNAISLGLFAGNGVSGILPLKTGTYFAKAIDASGNYSINAVSFVVTEGMLTGFTTVASLTESPAFSGGKTGVAVNAGSLVLSTGTLFDSIAGNFDSQTGQFDSGGGVQVTLGTYDFSTYIDLTSVATRRVEGAITAVASDNGDLFDVKPGLFDTQQGNFDGDAIDDADMKLYFSATNDDPAGTPAWGPWTPFLVSDVTARALKFKADLIVGTINHNIAVSALSVAVKT